MAFHPNVEINGELMSFCDEIEAYKRDMWIVFLSGEPAKMP